MMTTAIIWILAIIFVEALTEIVVASSIAQKVKDPIYRLHAWAMQKNCLLKWIVGKPLGLIHELTSCGQCTSVWVAASVAWALPGVLIVGSMPFDFGVKVFIIQRLSNVFHELLSRWFKRLPLTLSVHTTVTKYEEGFSYDATNSGDDSDSPS
jgi:hypothetical protein